MRVLLALFLLLAATVAASDEIVAGVDLDRVDWPTFCRNVEPVPVANCTASHPADNVHAVHAPFVFGDPQYVCDNLKKTYDRLTTCNDAYCNVCRGTWRSALQSRELFPTWYEPDMQLDSFRRKYFSDVLSGN